MTKLYKKNELGFVILWIVLYVVLTSIADNLSSGIGVTKSITAAVHVLMCAVLFFWVRKNDLSE